MKSIVLASNSPRRKELLEMIGLTFTVDVSHVDESYDETLNPTEIATYLSRIKTSAVAKRHSQDIVIGADTIVVCNNQILGKPQDDQEAYQMLKLLSDKEHSVITGVTIYNNKNFHSFYSETKVHFYKLTEDEINAYIQSKEPFDKAGGYGIQGPAAKFIKDLQGDFYTVMGLPVAQVYQYLKTITSF